MTERLAGLLATQAEAAGRLGSPMYEALLRRVASDATRDGPVRRVLTPYADDPGPAATGLRLLGAVHRLVLERRAGDLALSYPSVGGNFDAELAWPSFVAVLDQHADELVHLMAGPPQTNEVGRAAALVGGLLRLADSHGLPLRLFELGASAGLNLRPDRFRYEADAGGWGPPDSPVRLDPAWRGDWSPGEQPLDIVQRVGCDPSPVDPTSTEGRLVLTSYVWPDQAVRLQRLRGALEVAAAVPATVRRQTAAGLVSGLRLADGTVTVLWHSVMWQYLSPAEKESVSAHIRRLGAAATPDAPFAHLFLEPWRRTPGAQHDFLVVLQHWPGGDRSVLGSAPGHGVPVDWEG